MSRMLNQGRGFAAQLSIGFESVFNTAATTGTTIAHNGCTVVPSRDLNQSDTIIPNRSSAEPFQGNATVDGGITVPNDTNQLAIFLKATFGNPETTDPTDNKKISAVADGTNGTSKFTVASGHGVVKGDFFTVYGTTNYNGEWEAIAADATSITIKKEYVAEVFTDANVTKQGFTHVFKIRPSQPSFTLEQLHTDLAEMFVYTGCKISNAAFGAASDGQENVCSFDIMGSKYQELKTPLIITAFANGTAGKTKVTSAGHGFANDDRIVIAGSVNYNGVYVVSDKTNDDFMIDAVYTAETFGNGDEPVCCKAQIKSPNYIPLKRLNTFSATVYKDGAEYKATKDKEITFDMGLDPDQRVIGDNGFRSEIPEGKVTVDSALTVLFKNADWVRAGEKNITIAQKLVFASEYGVGELEINLPECKVELNGPGIEGPAGLTQQINTRAFCSDNSAEGSAATITLKNSLATF